MIIEEISKERFNELEDKYFMANLDDFEALEYRFAPYVFVYPDGDNTVVLLEVNDTHLMATSSKRYGLEFIDGDKAVRLQWVTHLIESSVLNEIYRLERCGDDW